MALRNLSYCGREMTTEPDPWLTVVSSLSVLCWFEILQYHELEGAKSRAIMLKVDLVHEEESKQILWREYRGLVYSADIKIRMCTDTEYVSKVLKEG